MMARVATLVRWTVALSMVQTVRIDAQADTALSGRWQLNVARSHYGGGADVRREELFDWDERRGGATCSIRSVLRDGRVTHATFTAPYDGTMHAVAGTADVDQVALRRVNPFIVDAIFRLRGTPVFAYRATLSNDRQSLTIVAVDPRTRAVRESVVVYDRVTGAHADDGRRKQ